jgi:16S rRNA (cytidine1402-2'-O)-methyltransferase
MGTLYLVATPIGNLEDITLRALRTLREVHLIACEDTRRTGRLLARYEIKTPLISYYEHNKLTKLGYILDILQTKDVALVSEAGMPGISDPGYELVRAAIFAGIAVVPIPGPSAPIAALAVSGLPTDSFVYLGFFPRRRKERRRFLQAIAREKRTLVAFEEPHRLLSSLEDIEEILGDREMALTRELTKLHEEVIRGSPSQVRAHFQEVRPRGEFTLVIAGAKEEAWEEEKVKEALKELRARGLSGREATKEVAKLSGHPRSEIYKIWLEIANRKPAKEGKVPGGSHDRS